MDIVRTPAHPILNSKSSELNTDACPSQDMGSDMQVDEYDMVEDKPGVAIITPTDSPDEQEPDAQLPEADSQLAQPDSQLPGPEPTADDRELFVRFRHHRLTKCRRGNTSEVDATDTGPGSRS